MSYDNFYPKLIFRKENRVCDLNWQDRQNTDYHMQNISNKMCYNYKSGHNLNVNRLFEAIKLDCRIAGDEHENTQINIRGAGGKMENHSIQVLGQKFGIGQTQLLRISFQNIRGYYLW
jgi:hypothetical protein